MDAETYQVLSFASPAQTASAYAAQPADLCACTGMHLPTHNDVSSYIMIHMDVNLRMLLI